MTNPYRGLTEGNFETVKEILKSTEKIQNLQKIQEMLVKNAGMSEDEAIDLIKEEFFGQFGWLKS